MREFRKVMWCSLYFTLSISMSSSMASLEDLQGSGCKLLPVQAKQKTHTAEHAQLPGPRGLHAVEDGGMQSAIRISTHLTQVDIWRFHGLQKQ